MADNPFDTFDETVNDPAVNPDAQAYENPFDRFDEPQESIGSTVVRSTAEPFNRGVISMLEFPVTLVNAAVAGGYALAGQKDPPQMPRPLTAAAEAAGVIAPPEDQKHGFIPRAFEFTGASTLISAALLNYGRIALADLSAVPTALQQMGRATASAPGQATAYDIAANFTASGGGAVARHFTDNETIIAMAELGLGFLPTGVVFAAKTLPTPKLVGKVYNWTLETLLPFTEKGGMVAASRRAQDAASGDPVKIARLVDLNSPVPPMQQSGDPGIIKLQHLILKSDPKIGKEWSDQLELAINQMAKEAEFPGGDVERAVHLLNIRQQKAVEEAYAAVEKLGLGATPREISVVARTAAQGALDDAVKLERAVWDMLDQNAPADIENAATTLSEIIASRSADADPKDIPAWIINRMSHQPMDDDLLLQLQRAGVADEHGVVDPQVLAQLEAKGMLNIRQRTLEDVKVLRSRVLQEMRDEKAAQGRGPNRTKLRILNKIQAALLEDLSATGVPGVDEARAFSSAVNDRFRSGRVGKLLGFDSTGADRVAPEDFLNNIVYGPASATASKMFGEMANEAPGLTLQYIKAQYLKSVVGDNGRVSQSAHDAFVKNLKNKDMFEIFPELEAELAVAAKTSAEALKLEVPQNQMLTTQLNKNQSRAALLLQASPGEEMSLVLKSKNPSGAIQDLMKVRTPSGRILATDRAAVLGLQDSFVEEIFTQASKEVGGEMIPQGKNLTVLLNKYKTVMSALHMSDAQTHRLHAIAENIRVAQLVEDASVNIGTTILDNNLVAPIELLAKWVGARAGGRMGADVGSGFVLAGFMSKQSTDRVMALTSSNAEKILIRSASNGELWRSLLVGPRSSNVAKERAAKILEREIMRLESAGTTMLAVGVQDTEE